MSHDKIGPNEQRLRELRQERMAKKRVPIPYAGKEKGNQGAEKLYGLSNQRGVKKGPRKP